VSNTNCESQSLDGAATSQVGTSCAPQDTDNVKAALKSIKQQQRREAKGIEMRDTATKAALQAAGETGILLPQGFKAAEASANLCYQILETQPWGYSFNLLTQQNEFLGEVIWPDHYGRVLNDALANAIRFSLIGVTSIDFSAAHVWDSLNALCRANPYDPVAKYLNGLNWDGVRRIDRLGHRYLSAADDEYTGAVLKKWLMAGVARTFYPGIKYDCVPILEGEQGTQKSGAIRELSVPWFSDAELGDVKDKDAIIQLQGVWIQELAELSALKRSELNQLKAFFSRSHDKFRAPHDKVAQVHPRRWVPIGTCNPGKFPAYLTDPTGNRRYQPVPTGKIDLLGLRADRDQLWAEAVHSFNEAIRELEPEDYYKVLELPQSLWPFAKAIQDARVLADGWPDILKHWLDEPYHSRDPDSRDFRHEDGHKVEGRKYCEILQPYLDISGKRIEVIHSRLLLSECLRIPPEKHHAASGKRLREAMERIGSWTFDASLSVGGVKGVSGYRRDPDTAEKG
jgi:predicted P-loop ATPase